MVGEEAQRLKIIGEMPSRPIHRIDTHTAIPKKALTTVKSKGCNRDVTCTLSSITKVLSRKQPENLLCELTI